MKGIGKAIVEHFLAEGANVSYASRSVQGSEFVDFKGAANGARAVGTNLDITILADIEKWVKAAAEEFGRIDIVVCNGK
jgi:3-oxoacyl-[acyl-carrier protein] reductase